MQAALRSAAGAWIVQVLNLDRIPVELNTKQIVPSGSSADETIRAISAASSTVVLLSLFEAMTSQKVRPQGLYSLSLANCYFAHDSSGFPTLLLFFDAQSGRSCYPVVRQIVAPALKGFLST
jgi:hypothetical protein